MNNLSPAETERLAKFVEENGESLQVAGKILLHGYSAEHSGNVYNNKADLTREVGDTLAAISLLIKSGDLDAGEVREAMLKKLGSITRYMDHQQDIVDLPSSCIIEIPSGKETS